MRETGRSIRLDEVTLNVVECGEGESVLLLHGFPDSADLWREVVPMLVPAGCRCIAPDLRGCGESEAPAEIGAYALDRVIADVLGLLDALGVVRVHVVGHDWGAILGWMLAARHPGRVASLVAVSVGHPAAFREAGAAQKLRSWYVLAFQARRLAEWAIRARRFAALRRLTGDHPECDRWIADLSRPGRLSAGLAWYRANLVPLVMTRVPAVRVPVLGVWSTGDVALTEDQMTGSQRRVDGAFRYERIEGVSHWIPLDAPECLADLVLEWVFPIGRRLPAGASGVATRERRPRPILSPAAPTTSRADAARRSAAE